MPRTARARSQDYAPERILEAALEEFSQKGFDGARTRDIAVRAEVALGLVQYHFGTKEELWKAAVERAFRDLEEGVDEVLTNSAPGDERAMLRGIIRGHVRFVAEHTAFIRIMHNEGKQRNPRMRWLTDRFLKPLFKRFSPFIERAQARGVLPANVTPAHVVYILLGAIGTVFHQSEEFMRVTGIDPRSAEAMEAHAAALEVLFVGNLSGEDPK